VRTVGPITRGYNGVAIAVLGLFCNK